jgi:hypothetical protein
MGLALALSIVVIPSTGSARAPSLPTSGALFGAYVQPGSHTGPDRRSAMTSFETLVGRQMSIERVYSYSFRARTQVAGGAGTQWTGAKTISVT